MPTAYKVLAMTGSAGQTGNGAQAIAAANTNYTLYTVPSATSTVVSTLTICNQTTTQQTYRVAVRPAGAALAAAHYIAFDVPIQANDSTALTLGITLAATDVITINASSTSMSFAAFGSEIT